jgi:hypothetical protein
MATVRDCSSDRKTSELRRRGSPGRFIWMTTLWRCRNRFNCAEEGLTHSEADGSPKSVSVITRTASSRYSVGSDRDAQRLGPKVRWRWLEPSP